MAATVTAFTIFKPSRPIIEYPREESTSNPQELGYHGAPGAEYEKLSVIEKYEYSFLDPQILDLNEIQNRIRSEEDYEGMLRDVQRGLERNPESYRLHFTLAYLYSLVGRESDMLSEIQRTLQINPHFIPALDVLDKFLD